jgi:hypothetical protein
MMTHRTLVRLEYVTPRVRPASHALTHPPLVELLLKLATPPVYPVDFCTPFSAGGQKMPGVGLH